ncbi:MAG: class II fumarate hydratase [Acidimicrobiales bacterium]
MGAKGTRRLTTRRSWATRVGAEPVVVRPQNAEDLRTMGSNPSKRSRRAGNLGGSRYRRAMSDRTPAGFRTEHDSMGDVLVPEDAKWAAQTQRAVENFPISGLQVERSLIAALATLKGAAAVVNARQKSIPKPVADAIASAAAEVADGRWDAQFPVDVYQTGSGTSTNMNMNEVLASLATERLADGSDVTRVHPNDHVNASQSSNDMFPSAIHLAATRELKNGLVPALDHLAKALRKKQREFAKVVKSGRTHLMDATPVTLGQEFGGYAAAIEHGIERIEAALPRIGELPLGGTAVGTGINAPKGFAKAVIARLAIELDLPLSEARDHFEAQGARDALVEASGVLRTISVSLYKCANDLRWMSSGPRCGLGEIRIPDLQPGSSIMPGKVNPVVPEAVCQVVAQVMGNDAAVAFGGTAGNLELNVMLPVIARNLLESIRLLTNVSRVFADRCISGIEADVERCRTYALSSPSIGTSLNPYIGYEKAAEVIKESVRTGKDLRTIVLEKGLLSEADADRALDVMAMTKGGILK